MYSDRQIKGLSYMGYMDLTNGYESKAGPDGKVKLTDIMTESDRQELELRGITKEEYSKWSVVAVHDTNDKNGFYACVIETSPGNAVISFRGSEGMEYSYGNLQHDWVEADLGLLNSTATTQHREVDRFLNENKQLLEQYNITMTGHSLGGNLAEYAAIKSSKYGLDDNLEQCVSMDGPGFSNEFIVMNLPSILKMQSKMKHYRWSLVGGLLYDLPGVEYHYLQVENVSDSDQYNILSRHDTKYVTVKDGNFQYGLPDPLALYTSILTKQLDALPIWTGNLFKSIASLSILGIGKAAYTVSDLIKALQDLSNKSKQTGGSGGRSFGGAASGGRGSADVIKVSTEAMAETVRKYESEKSRLTDALTICNNAAQQLARSWAGPSFLEMSIKMAATYKNLMQSLDQAEDAISELNQVIQIMERTENSNTAIASALETGDSPFA